MHGIVRPETLARERRAQTAGRLRELAFAWRHFLALVVAPTLLIAAYLYAVAADQYQSGADFIVRRADAPGGGAGLGQLFGLGMGGSATTPEARLVEDFLLSHEAVARLRREDQLVARFRRPHIDPISRLWFADPAPERLLAYYRGKVTIDQEVESGISRLHVRAFTPGDAHAIAAKLLALGEARINALNERSYRDRVASARAELDAADLALGQAQGALTAFRRVHADIDPEGSGKAQVGLVSTLTASLVAERARLRTMDGVISPDSPQYRAVQAQLRALEAQVAGQTARIAGSGGSIAASLGDYESLVIRRESAARRFAAVAAQLDQATAEAKRQQLYLIRVVDANLPVKALYPARFTIVLTTFLSLALAYAIGWMLLSGIREHAL